MTLISIVTIISFLLEGVFSNMINITNSFFAPLFSIVILIVIYPYFNHEESSFLKTCFVLGLAYDFIYTDTLIVNACIFLIIGYFIIWLNSWLSNHSISVLFMSFITIVVYRILMYTILVIVGFLPFNINALFISIYSSIILNLIYADLLYLICDYFSKKYNIKKID